MQKPPAHFVGPHSYDGIGAGVVGAILPIEINADEPLFQEVRLSVERSLNDMRKELAAAFASAERIAGHGALQLFPHQPALGVSEERKGVFHCAFSADSALDRRVRRPVNPGGGTFSHPQVYRPQIAEP